jgi:ABC-2 type transport system permease protein
MLGMLLMMPLSLLFGGNLDIGVLAAGLLGTILFISTLMAIGLYISSLTAHPTVAAISTFGIVLFLWMLNWAEPTAEQSGVLSYLAITTHHQSLLSGLFNSADVIYHLLLITLFLILSIQRLDSERIQ